MTNLTQSQPNPNMTFHRIFDIGPRIQSLAFTSDEVKAYVLHFIAKIKTKIGSNCQLSAFPQRVFTQSSWKVHAKGDKGEVHLLFNISGRFQLPAFSTENWPARLNVELTDHVDAYWLIQYLLWKLAAIWESPADLSPVFGDKTVGNE
ncbi:hypothetical protein HMPREF2776_05945 [Haemophilus sp. HMSC066D03]|uniref:hypothetical protein n=1 Tax=unclassified Haemophilus TaxID=2609962 RepID=UPI0008A475E1|nr:MULTISPECIES: hypothetical protein [unclassified Haemophilus]OFS54399.1 hypothetical protein HMPREF2776_05945 [Haemophilus sp. HMSC066D03]OFS56741.1 hypothetical protein HMPREF2750_01795 [Haemophilus sp. HMSC066D02]